MSHPGTEVREEEEEKGSSRRGTWLPSNLTVRVGASSLSLSLSISLINILSGCEPADTEEPEPSPRVEGLKPVQPMASKVIAVPRGHHVGTCTGSISRPQRT